ncbi:2-desacetyl-2-hydroxyethyl bacteriochlorophyllide A dehydrogenase [beta proteobacterium AAP99]|nr:2-desacetyl-2-hydroxyethyl bacteriochlorophyllide A dehydrogenase [beta proteobacterium AAP99]
MNTVAVVMEQPERVSLTPVSLSAPTEADVVVDMMWSGISTGTERLLWTGRMPAFPGMGYPLVPGYESVGRVSEAGSRSGLRAGDLVFVPGAKCFGEVRGLFGGSAARVVVPGARVIEIPEQLGENGVLLALAATAHHAIVTGQGAQPELIVGHGVLGRLIARLAMLSGAQPTVWETNAVRQGGAAGYRVIHPDEDTRRDYHCIVDVSGDADLIDTLIARLAPGGEVVLAGFYAGSVSFNFAPAFMREARLRIAAQWQPTDLQAVTGLVCSGRLDLSGLITHRSEPQRAEAAYRTAFSDAECLKMILDWRALS